jgi:hypothetical protein
MHAMSPRKRNWMRGLGLLVALAAWLTAPARPVLACSCAMSPGPDAEFSRSAAVFTGTVTGISQRTGLFLLDRIRQLFGLSPQVSSLDSVHVNLAVANSWKGVTTTPVTVVTGQGDADCGYGFDHGRQYLVYAYENGAMLGTNICMRTAEVGVAATDLAYLSTRPVLTVTQSPSRTPLLCLAGAALALGSLALAGGTAWVWCRRAASLTTTEPA